MSSVGGTEVIGRRLQAGFQIFETIIFVPTFQRFLVEDFTPRQRKGSQNKVCTWRLLA